jgi:hypothetical protein
MFPFFACSYSNLKGFDSDSTSAKCAYTDLFSMYNMYFIRYIFRVRYVEHVFHSDTYQEWRYVQH